MRSASQFRPGAPPALTSRLYARDLRETQEVGGSFSDERTPDQEASARWHTEMAQFQFNRIANAEVQTDGRSLLEHARLFALLNMAMADAVTAVFDAKYTLPVLAAVDGNPQRRCRRESTNGGRSQLGAVPDDAAPPRYPAAHGTVQGAGARVLTWYFGRRYEFETTSPTVPGVKREYRSFNHFAREGAVARIFGGMHFRNSLVIGSQQGRQVADWVLDRYLKPHGKN